MLKATALSVNHIFNSTAVNPSAYPSFGWTVESDIRDTMQTAYRIQLAFDEAFSEPVFDSGIVKSDMSQNIRPEIALKATTRYFWRVQVQDNHGQSSQWAVSYFRSAMPDGVWPAEFISAETENDRGNSKGTCVKGNFELKKSVKSAVIYATALGLYEIYLDGERIGDLHLTPGWTSYNNQLLYQAYDITDSLTVGTHTLGAMIGAGWYKGVMGFRKDRRNNFGTHTAFSAVLHIEYDDSSCEDIVTDTSWLASDSPVLFSEIYDGEIYDAALEDENWCTPHSDKTKWRPVETVSFNKEVIHAQEGCFVKDFEVLPVKEVIVTPEGDTVLDFGQNFSGYVSFSVNGKAGDKVVLRHFEILDAQGNVYTKNLRTAKQTIEYRLKGGKTETYRPHFTFQGFRYVHVAEYPGEIDPSNFTAHVIHSDMRYIGDFSCSNPLINSLEHNILWGLKSNFVDVPTDCPQRDERLGWTGDAQIFGATACYLMDAYPFFKKWLTDLKLEQREDGAIPHVVPDVIGEFAAAAWSDAATILPYDVYLSSGDRDILKLMYPTMKGWVRYVYDHSENHTLWTNHFQYGDWLALDAKEGSYHGATPDELTATAYYANSVNITAKTAKLLGYIEEADYYKNLHKEIVKAFQDEFFTPSGRLAANTQTAHILALNFSLVPEKYMDRTIKNLLKLLSDNDGHLTTGFTGTPYFCRVLADAGHIDAAYELLLKDDFPSWLYQVKMGATTVWEHWDGLKPDGSMWSADMNSFNHYAYGAVGRFLYEVVAGIQYDESIPGYKHIIMHPQPGGGLTYAKSSHKSPYGLVSCDWEKSGDTLTVSVTVPANTTALFKLDNAESVINSDGVQFELNGKTALAEIGSGSYTFTFKQ